MSFGAMSGNGSYLFPGPFKSNLNKVKMSLSNQARPNTLGQVAWRVLSFMTWFTRLPQVPSAMDDTDQTLEVYFPSVQLPFGPLNLRTGAYCPCFSPSSQVALGYIIICCLYPLCPSCPVTKQTPVKTRNVLLSQYGEVNSLYPP